MLPRLSLLLCLLPCILKAAAPSSNSTYYQIHQPYAALHCNAPAPTNKTAPTDCLNQQLRSSEQQLDQLMNTLKQQLKTSLNQGNTSATWLSPPITLLEQAQTDWRIFRDSQCALETLPSVGQASYQNHLNICRLSYTRERIDYLRWFLSPSSK